MSCDRDTEVRGPVDMVRVNDCLLAINSLLLNSALGRTRTASSQGAHHEPKKTVGTVCFLSG